MSIEIKPTRRGFGRGEFVDTDGQRCYIQESSVVGGPFIRLGLADPKVKVCIQNLGWVDCNLPESANVSGCMHLTQEQAAALIPLLQRFIDTGNLVEK